MNKILKAAHSHYVAQRDILMADLEALINKDGSPNVSLKAIEAIEKLALANLCIDTVRAIIDDNKGQDFPNISELLAQRLGANNIDEKDFDEEQKTEKED